MSHPYPSISVDRQQPNPYVTGQQVGNQNNLPAYPIVDDNNRAQQNAQQYKPNQNYVRFSLARIKEDMEEACKISKILTDSKITGITITAHRTKMGTSQTTEGMGTTTTCTTTKKTKIPLVVKVVKVVVPALV